MKPLQEGDRSRSSFRSDLLAGADQTFSDFIGLPNRSIDPTLACKCLEEIDRMFATLAETYAHRIRWGLAIGWLILILSLFYDPVSAVLTAPNQVFAATTENGCYQFQGECLPLTPYPIGARIFWGMVLPLVVLTLLIFGHEAWRRICPLSFFSQIPRALGWQRRRAIDESSWLGQNALLLQWSLLFIGLNLRLLLVNSDRRLLGIFLLLTIAAAISIGFLYDGKTWCNYFCPMAPVQIIYSEPSGLLGSEAHTALPKTITQSMCRTVNSNGQEKSACVACKMNCMDIDAEGNYWTEIRQPDRKLLYYGYVGLVIGFYLYFWLYSGSWNFLAAGVWNETNQFSSLFNPGFFVAGRSIPIPKFFAVPLTLITTTGTTYAIGLWAEQQFKQANKRRGYPLTRAQVQSRLFAIATFLAFNLLFFLGVRPTIGYLPAIAQQFISWMAIVVSSLWIAKVWRRSDRRYSRERDANLLRRQLTKLNINVSQSLDGRSLDDLNPDELYALAKVLPDFSQDYRFEVYQGVLKDAFEQRSVTPAASLKVFQPLRHNLQLAEELHWLILEGLQAEQPLLFDWPHSTDTTVRMAIEHPQNSEATVFRPIDQDKTQIASSRSYDMNDDKTTQRDR